MKNFWLHFLFLIIVTGDLIGEFTGIKGLDYVFKPLILIWIAGYFLLHANNVDAGVVKRLSLAFLFSWLGDILLMLTHINPIFFIAGLFSFLIAQVFYIFLFLKTITLSGRRPFLVKKPFWVFPFMVYGMLVYMVLFSKLDDAMRVAVFIYMVALLSMAAMALNRFGNGHPISFTWVLIGAFLFVISDTLIAFNKFMIPIPYEGLLVMPTYIAAQYFIMRGILKQYE